VSIYVTEYPIKRPAIVEKWLIMPP